MDSTRRKLIAVLLPLRSLASMPQRFAGTAKVEAVGGEAELS